MDDDDYDYEQVLQYENEIYQVNEEESESENEDLTNALAQIYYAVDNSKSNISSKQEVIPKNEVTKSNEVDTIVSEKDTRTNNVPLKNNQPRSRKDLKQELESDDDSAMPHDRKRIVYEDDYRSYNEKCCALCKEYNHDERTCENILYPDNDESTWRKYSMREETERKRNIKVYCYNCAGNHLGQDCSAYKFSFAETSSLSSRIGVSQREYARSSAKNFS